jgi:hypothetical protein
MDLGGAHAAADARGARTMSVPRRHAPMSGTRWRPLSAMTPAFPKRRRQTSLGEERWQIDDLVLCYFVYIFMPTSICFYDTLSVHGSSSIFCMFMIFLFTFYVNICRFLRSVPQCINTVDM